MVAKGGQGLGAQQAQATQAKGLVARMPVQRKATDYTKKAGRRIDRAR